MTSTEHTYQLSPYASFPVDCPQCGRQTMHACGRIRKHFSLFSLSIPKGLPSLYVQCVECKLVRQVPRADRAKLRPLIKDDAVSYALKHAGERETSLGRVAVDPDRIRLLPIKAIGKTTRVVFYFVGLLLLLGIGSLFCRGGYTIYQNACLLRGVRLAEKAVALADDGEYRAAVRHLNRAQRLAKGAGRPYDQAACLIVMGHLRLRLGDYRGAIRAYEKSLRVSEQAGLYYVDRYALTGMGVAYERMGDNDAARKAYEAAEEMLTERHGDDEKDFVQERIEQLDRILGQWLKSV